MPSDKEQEFQFKYKFDINYNPTYANGAYGGITPQKEIVLNFYQERMPLPHVERHLFTQDGASLTIMKDVSSFDPPEHTYTMVRFVETGIIMNLKTAREIYEFLEKNIKQLEAME